MSKLDWEKNNRQRKFAESRTINFKPLKYHLFKIQDNWIAALSWKHAWWRYYNDTSDSWLNEATEKQLKEAINTETGDTDND